MNNTRLLKTEPLSANEMTDLLKRVSEGDLQAREKLVETNLRLVASVLSRIKTLNHEYDDLFQVGTIGLIKAIDRFEPSYGTRLSTYAVPLILGEVQKYIRDHSTIKVSRRLKQLAIEGKKAEDKLREAKGKDPAISDIAKEMDVDTEELVQAFEANRSIASLDAPFNDDDTSLMDKVSLDHNQEDKFLEKISLKDAIDSLDKRLKEVLLLKFFKGKTQSEIAVSLGTSQASVSRIEKKALIELKKYLQ